MPGEAAAEHLRLFRNGVNAGLSQIRRIPGGSKVRQPPGLLLLECLKNREADVLRFLTDTAIPPTSNQADYAGFRVMPAAVCMLPVSGGGREVLTA